MAHRDHHHDPDPYYDRHHHDDVPIEQHAHNNILKNIDSNKDGIISESEIDREKELLKIYQIEQKVRTQRRMAWIAMFGIILMTIFLFTPIISIAKIKVLAELLGMYYLANASIIGFYFGAQAYMGK